MMNNDLENMIGNVSGSFSYKSNGEQRIASFFDNYGIRYQYEPGILVYPSASRPRIWYPDFYLPDFAVYVEYFGLAGDINYDEGMIVKSVVYKNMDLAVIPVYSWMFAEDWQGYISRELYRISDRRYRSLNAKLPLSYNTGFGYSQMRP